ncbi:MAG TPA: hypothetical protein VEZ41_15840 [Allosphingosinicella sp.]|nr:hypothetical protein [Allosphingosinicella sp.]
MSTALQNWLKTNWFTVAVPVLLLIEWLAVRDMGGEMGRFLEIVVLFDLCVFMPLLYVLCYRRTVPLKQLVLRTVALVCLGIYLATYLVPEPLQALLPQLGPLRIAGLAVLVLIELRLLIAALRIVWGSNGSLEQVQAASGAPAWIARLMVMEARFWKWLWSLIRRR